MSTAGSWRRCFSKELRTRAAVQRSALVWTGAMLATGLRWLGHDVALPFADVSEERGESPVGVSG